MKSLKLFVIIIGLYFLTFNVFWYFLKVSYHHYHDASLRVIFMSLSISIIALVHLEKKRIFNVIIWGSYFAGTLLLINSLWQGGLNMFILNETKWPILIFQIIYLFLFMSKRQYEKGLGHKLKLIMQQIWG